jgi:hypothetical protein
MMACRAAAYPEPMLKRIGLALAPALLVAACGSSGHSSSTSTAAVAPTSASTSATASAPAPATTSASSSSASSSTATAPATTSSSARSTSSSSSHTHTQPPNPTPHFIVKLKIRAGDTLTPPSVAIGGHTLVDLSVDNASGSAVKLELAHGTKPVFSRSLPTGATTAKLPALPNATYNVVLDGTPRGTLTIGAQAGP